MQTTCFGVVSSATSYNGATEVNYSFEKYLKILYREKFSDFKFFEYDLHYSSPIFL